MTGAGPAEPTIEAVLKSLFQEVRQGNPEIVSLALGDRHGLPVVDAVRGKTSPMALTATATMSLRSAISASTTVGLKPAQSVHIHAEDGEIVVHSLGTSGYVLIAQLKPNANLGLALVVLRQLGQRLLLVLSEEFGAVLHPEYQGQSEVAPSAAVPMLPP